MPGSKENLWVGNYFEEVGKEEKVVNLKKKEKSTKKEKKK